LSPNHNSSVFNEKLDKVIAFYNPKSGGQKGEIIHEKLKNYLKHENIYDLTKGGPKPGYLFIYLISI
jgi:hypothetical protein